MIDGKVIASFEVARVPPPQPEDYAIASVQGKGIWADGSQSRAAQGKGSSEGQGSSHGKGSKAVVLATVAVGIVALMAMVKYAMDRHRFSIMQK